MKRIVFFSFHYNTGSVSLRDGKFLLFILNSSPSLEDYVDLTSLTTCQVPAELSIPLKGSNGTQRKHFIQLLYLVNRQYFTYVHLHPVHPYLLCCIFVWFCYLEIGSHSVTPANLEFTMQIRMASNSQTSAVILQVLNAEKAYSTLGPIFTSYNNAG